MDKLVHLPHNALRRPIIKYIIVDGDDIQVWEGGIEFPMAEKQIIRRKGDVPHMCVVEHAGREDRVLDKWIHLQKWNGSTLRHDRYEIVPRQLWVAFDSGLHLLTHVPSLVVPFHTNVRTSEPYGIILS